MQEKKTLGLISLGCDKNRVDSEKLLASIKDDYILTSDMNEAQIIVVNSCAFLESSRKESIEAVFDANMCRESGKLEKIIMTGCLPQRFIDDFFDEFTEVDGFLGTFDYDLFNETVERCYKGERVNNVKKGKNLCTLQRKITTPLHYAYLKIADGCDNKCTYCLIPSIRGKFNSVPVEVLKKEAEELGDLSELILVAQDITKYGLDIYGEKSLVKLIRELSTLDNIEHIRLLYCYPELIDDELIEEINSNQKVVKYLDIPLQHASSSVLKRMNRKGTLESYMELCKKLKERVKGIAIRSTFIAGFPGETEEDFETLKKFLKEAKLFNAGFFAYSREEGTPAYKLPDQIDQDVKERRVKELYDVQKEVALSNLKPFVGKTIDVLCDGIDYEKGCFVGRAYFQAPDIDGVVYFNSKDDIVVEQGQVYKVKISQTTAYDLIGRIA